MDNITATWVDSYSQGGCNADKCSTMQQRVLLITGLSFQLRLCVYHAVELRIAIGDSMKGKKP